MNTNKKLKFVTIGAATVVAVLLIVVIIANVMNNRNNSADKQKQAYMTAYQQANDAAASEQYDTAIERLQTYLKTNPSKEYTRNVYAQMGTIYANKEDYKSAISWYEKAEKLGGKNHLDTATGLAYAYQSQGNKAKAIEYFNLAIDLSKKSDDPMAKGDIESYQNQISQLEAKQ